MLFVCYPACSTCKKAQTYLDEMGKAYEIRNIKLAVGKPKAVCR